MEEDEENDDSPHLYAQAILQSLFPCNVQFKLPMNQNRNLNLEGGDIENLAEQESGDIREDVSIEEAVEASSRTVKQNISRGMITVLLALAALSQWRHLVALLEYLNRFESILISFGKLELMLILASCLIPILNISSLAAQIFRTKL